MATARLTNRQMFWRILRRLLTANPGRLFVILLALGAGAAVTAALLNLQVDAKRRLTTEFKMFGPNVVIGPRSNANSPGLLDESLFEKIPERNQVGEIGKAEFLYGVVDVSLERETQLGTRVVLVGYAHSAFDARRVVAPALVDAEEKWKLVNSLRCGIGQKLAAALKMAPNDGIRLSAGGQSYTVTGTILAPTGGPEDNQVFFFLERTQELLGHPGQISLIQLSVPGTAEQINQFVQQLQPGLGDAEARPVSQFTDAQAKIYSRISGLLNFTVGIVLVLTALCVMAAMTNVAAERKNDVGLMKAIGGATRRVLRIFLAEAALLGLAGGIAGAALGILLSIYLGKQVFGVAAQPRLIVYPLSVALTILVAILSAFPLRRLAGVRPAAVFRGEE